MGIPKTIKEVDFDIEHLYLMDIRKEELMGIMTLKDVDRRLDALGHNSIQATTFTCDGVVLFSAGYYELWPGVIECWMIPSSHVKKVMYTFCKLLKTYVRAIIEREECHRFQASAPDDELHARWMKFLELEKEGTMKKYTHNGQDYCMYARTI
jgi:hypothetical protein